MHSKPAKGIYCQGGTSSKAGRHCHFLLQQRHCSPASLGLPIGFLHLEFICGFESSRFLSCRLFYFSFSYLRAKNSQVSCQTFTSIFSRGHPLYSVRIYNIPSHTGNNSLGKGIGLIRTKKNIGLEVIASARNCTEALSLNLGNVNFLFLKGLWEAYTI